MAAPIPASAYDAYNAVSDDACPNPAHPTPQKTPAIVIRTRGPRLSIIHPHRDMAQVSSAMKSVQPHWTSESFQPVALVNGPVNSVQPYCRLAIMIIAVTAAPRRIQRFTGILLTAAYVVPSSSYKDKLSTAEQGS